ncbi:hypothetical protein [Streptomyces sp. IBSBF 2435]|uniref:hypothetical protein n=1 Tax=Streptomyces sp. IBSBF 2435 TaxID=2903531 RepID=UPI002FDBEC2A
MADLEFTDNLATNFSQFDEIAGIHEAIRSRLDRIRALNLAGGGRDDEYAKSYHEQVKTPTSDLDTLLGGVGTLLGATGENGSTVSRTFDDVEGGATETAKRGSMG